VCVFVCVSGNLYVYHHTGNPADRTPRSASNKCNISPANAACNKAETHFHGRSKRLIRHSLSTASVFVSRLSGPKSQPCGLHSSRINFLCRTSCRTQRSSTTSSHKLANRRQRWRTSQTTPQPRAFMTAKIIIATC